MNIKKSLSLLPVLALAGCIGTQEAGNPAETGLCISIAPEHAPEFSIQEAENKKFYRRFIVDIYDSKGGQTPLSRKVLVYDDIITDGSTFRLPVRLPFEEGGKVCVWSDMIKVKTDEDVFFNSSSLGNITLTEETGDRKFAHGLWGNVTIGKETPAVQLQSATANISVVAEDRYNFIRKHGEEIMTQSELVVTLEKKITGFNAVQGHHLTADESVSFHFPLAAAVKVDDCLTIGSFDIFTPGSNGPMSLSIDVKDNTGTVLFTTGNVVAEIIGGKCILQGSFLTGEEPEPEPEPDPDPNPEPEPNPEPIETTLQGLGTETEPYLIGTPADLLEMMRLINSGLAMTSDFKQTADIMLTNDGTVTMERVCIGTAGYPFKGSFDGSGWLISGTDGTAEKGAYISGATETMGETGLFGVVENAALKNIRIVVNNQNKTGFSTSSAGLCGVSKGNTTITDVECLIQNITCNGLAVGGLVGTVENGTLTVTACKTAPKANVGVKGNDTSNKYIGGIIGYVKAGATAIVTDSYNTAKIVQTPDEDDFMGGICGGNDGTLTITRCYNTGVFTYNKDIADATAAMALSGTLVGGGETLSGVTVDDCWYLAGAKKTKARFNQGSKFSEGNWPAWDVDNTAWKSVGAFSADNNHVYPSLDWEK